MVVVSSAQVLEVCFRIDGVIVVVAPTQQNTKRDLRGIQRRCEFSAMQPMQKEWPRVASADASLQLAYTFRSLAPGLASSIINLPLLVYRPNILSERLAKK